MAKRNPIRVDSHVAKNVVLAKKVRAFLFTTASLFLLVCTCWAMSVEGFVSETTLRLAVASPDYISAESVETLLEDAWQKELKDDQLDFQVEVLEQQGNLKHPVLLGKNFARIRKSMAYEIKMKDDELNLKLSFLGNGNRSEGQFLHNVADSMALNVSNIFVAPTSETDVSLVNSSLEVDEQQAENFERAANLVEQIGDDVEDVRSAMADLEKNHREWAEVAEEQVTKFASSSSGNYRSNRNGIGNRRHSMPIFNPNDDGPKFDEDIEDGSQELDFDIAPPRDNERPRQGRQPKVTRNLRLEKERILLEKLDSFLAKRYELKLISETDPALAQLNESIMQVRLDLVDLEDGNFNSLRSPGRNTIAPAAYQQEDPFEIASEFSDDPPSARVAGFPPGANVDEVRSAFTMINASQTKALAKFDDINEALNSIDVLSLKSTVKQIRQTYREQEDVRDRRIAFHKNLNTKRIAAFVVKGVESGKNRPLGGLPNAAHVIAIMLLSLFVGSAVTWAYLPLRDDAGFGNTDHVESVLGVPVLATVKRASETMEIDEDVPLANLIVQMSRIVLLGILIVIAIGLAMSPAIRDAFVDHPFHGLCHIMWNLLGK